MQVPCVTPIEIASEDICESSIQKREEEEEIKTIISRNTCIENTLKLEHLNAEEKKSMTEICTQYNNIFHLKGDPLTHTDTVAHEIHTQVDSAPVNVKPYRIA